MSDFASFSDVQMLAGKVYSEDEQERIDALLPLVCDTLRYEAEKVGKDLDTMAAASNAYTNTLKLVTCDIVIRAMRQSVDGDPMSQESQSALGYSWSGTYAVPGGGIAAAIMKNDLKRLGLRRQKIGGMYIWQAESTEST